MLIKHHIYLAKDVGLLVGARVDCVKVVQKYMRCGKMKNLNSYLKNNDKSYLGGGLISWALRRRH